MPNLSKKTKIIIVILIFAFVLAVLPFVIYLKIIPNTISNPDVINYIQKSFNESLGVELNIKNPVLKTEFSPLVVFKVEELSLLKNKDTLLDIKDLNTELSLKDIMAQKIKFKKVGLEYLFIDINKLMQLSPPKQEAAKSNWYFDFFDSLLYIKKCVILYKASPDTDIKVLANNIEITETRNPKFVKFKVNVIIKKNKNNFKININDQNSVYIKNRKLFVDNCLLKINNSNIFVKSISDEKNNFDMSIYSKSFDLKNVVELINSNIMAKDTDQLLSCFKDIKGNFKFFVNLTNKNTNGEIVLNSGSLKIIPLNNLPLMVQSGKIKINKNVITLNGFKGYYGKNKKNKIELNGSIKDYLKSLDTNIDIKGLATNEFSKYHLSKIVGYPIELIGDAKTKMIVKSVYNKIDLVWMFKLEKGQDILIDGASLSPTNYERALKADFHFENNLLNIKSINYYIASTLNKNTVVKPILTIFGNVDCSKDVNVKNLGFIIPKPLPSEFLNVLIGQKLFKKGTISGNLEVINNKTAPILNGTISLNKVRIPSQRLSIKEAKVTTNKNTIDINAFGKFKRSEYKFSANILNQIKFPIIVKKVNLTINDIDIEKLMNSMNSQNTNAASVTKISNEEGEDAYTFDSGIIIVEECFLNVVKGHYKEIEFGNLLANLTLDKNGILEIKSNRFDFAKGMSSCKIFCDLKKHIYSVKLGVKNIDSDLIATTLLALKKEISGKASGIIHINTDDSLKLNGSMKFVIKNGTIGKIGLVEYVMKFASLFRNPLAMISPSTIIDLVNIPEGNFDKINGEIEIKDNIIEKIKIKSSSPQLSSYIVGRFDLENRDATLRIYTKFSSIHKGFSGFMRNLSLNSLANRVPLSSRNDANYYSAELKEIPPIQAQEKDCQIFLTKVDGDIERNNFLSSLKKIK